MAERPPLELRISRDPEWMRRPFFTFLFGNLPALVIIVSMVLLYGLFLTHKIDLVTADLGRHIKNGEVLLDDTSVLERNFYSYTQPDFEVLNHHWGGGAQVLFIVISLAALAAFIGAARLYAGWDTIGFVALVALPLLAERTEIRPEALSYLFAGLFFLILCIYRESFGSGATSHALPRTYDRAYAAKLLWLLPLIEIFWVNSHIYFILGPLLIGAFIAESLISRRSQLKRLLLVFTATVVATIVSPFGYRSLMETVTIFQNYGYRLAENQSVVFMQRLGGSPNLVLFELAFGLLIIVVAIIMFRNRKSLRPAHLFVGFGLSVMAWLAIRNISLFGLFFIPLTASLVESATPATVDRRLASRWAASLLAALLVIFVLFGLQRYFPYWRQFGIGPEKGNSRAAEFILANDINGPIFNNYDIGGYLIYHLYPNFPVFVDNRPEAYPVSFFQDVYILMQEDERVWRQQLEKHGFNSIIFAHRDATPWGQTFLRSRIFDPSWAPVFADDRVIVFLRRSPDNESTIRRFEIPRSNFLVR